MKNDIKIKAKGNFVSSMISGILLGIVAEIIVRLFDIPNLLSYSSYTAYDTFVFFFSSVVTNVNILFTGFVIGIIYFVVVQFLFNRISLKKIH